MNEAANVKPPDENRLQHIVHIQKVENLKLVAGCTPPHWLHNHKAALYSTSLSTSNSCSPISNNHRTRYFPIKCTYVIMWFQLFNSKPFATADDYRLLKCSSCVLTAHTQCQRLVVRFRIQDTLEIPSLWGDGERERKSIGNECILRNSFSIEIML